MTIYRRIDKDTRPRGFGHPPTYHITKPTHSDADMVWIEEVEIAIPDDYTIGTADDGQQYLYDSEGIHETIIDDHGHPAIVVGLAKDYTRCLRLDTFTVIK